MKLIKPGNVNGRISAPPSKSIIVRALAAALLVDGKTVIENASFCDDALAAMDVISLLGARTHQDGRVLEIESARAINNPVLNCRESGLTIRLFSAIAALFDSALELQASGSLSVRPMDMIEQPIQALGGQCKTSGGFAPVLVCGPITGGHVTVDATETSQFLSGLLMALPLCKEDSSVSVPEIKSAPYVEVTIDLLNEFGIDVFPSSDFNSFEVPGRQTYKSGTYRVEGDWSGASFLLVAGALTGSVELTDLDGNAAQADRAILDALKLAGAHVNEADELITVEKNQLKAFQFDATNCPDLFPPLAALAVGCNGVSEITGVTRLFHKESDRASALVSEFGKIGGHISVDGDRMIITGGSIEGGSGDAHGDHRIAMALSLAGLISKGGVSISGWQCVSKSYPEYFEDLKKLTENAK